MDDISVVTRSGTPDYPNFLLGLKFLSRVVPGRRGVGTERGPERVDPRGIHVHLPSVVCPPRSSEDEGGGCVETVPRVGDVHP